MSDNATLDEETGQEIVSYMDPAALTNAKNELSHLAPGPSEPLRFGDEGIQTQLEEEPISEVAPFRESLP